MKAKPMFTLHRTRNLFRTLTVLGLALAAPGFAAEVVLPHAFSPGTPARANEVNANFAAVRNGVNANDAAITNLNTQVQNLDAQVQALDTEVQNLAQAATGVRGLAVTVNGGAPIGTVVALQESSPGIITLSDLGYFFSVSGDDDYLPEGTLLPLPIFYDQINCAGNRYYTSDTAPGDLYISHSYILFRQGVVVGSPDPGENGVAYLVQGSGSNVTVRSVMDPDSGSCVNIGNQNVRGVPVSMNNAAITGVPSDLSGAVRLVTR